MGPFAILVGIVSRLTWSRGTEAGIRCEMGVSASVQGQNCEGCVERVKLES